MTYQSQSVDVIVLDILHDVPVLHPFRDGCELACPHVPLDPSEFQDVRVGQRIPEDNFSTKLLKKDGQLQVTGKISLARTFLIFKMLSCAETLKVLTATRRPP